MRLARMTTVIILILFLAPLIPSPEPNYTLSETYEISARDSSVVISELFISPNQLASNESSDNIYGAVD